MKVSKNYTVITGNWRDFTGKIKPIDCLVDGSGIGSSEYTVCGIATPDSTLKFEDYEFVSQKNGGIITCKNCIQKITWFKNIK